MSEIFGDVIHAGLDTDKYKYPIGEKKMELIIHCVIGLDYFLLFSFQRLW
jgi:hypothetical protein